MKIYKLEAGHTVMTSIVTLTLRSMNELMFFHIEMGIPCLDLFNSLILFAPTHYDYFKIQT